MPQALALVKKKLGSSAVILHTRPVRQGGFAGIGGKTIFEITAKAEDTTALSGSTGRQGEAYKMQNNYNKDRRELFEAISQVSSMRKDSGVRLDIASLKQQDRVNANGAYSAANSSGAWTKADTTSSSKEVYKDIRDELGELKTIINDLVKEQRQLHAPQMPEKVFDTYLDLIQREVADEIAREMLEEVQHDLTGSQMRSEDVIRRKLLDTMQGMVNTCGPIADNMDGSARVVMLIGPTGVGKTTTIAKVAADMKLRRGKDVGLITIDTYRIGAVDQLRMYAQIIDVPLRVVLSPAELNEALEEMRQTKDVVLIDTAGRSHTDAIKLKELQTYINAAKADELHLVLSGTSNQSSIDNAAKEFGKLGVDRVILTKLDEAISFGVIFSVLRKLDASLSYITTGQDVPDDIEVAAGSRLAKMLLGEEGVKKLEIAV